MAIAHHVASPKSPFCDPAIKDRCLLNGLSQEQPCASFRAKYQTFIDTGKVVKHADHFSKGVMEMRVTGVNY